MALKLRSDEPKPKKERSGQLDSNKTVIAAVVAIVAVILLFLIGVGILFVHTLNRFAEDDSAQVTTITYSIKTRPTGYDFGNGSVTAGGNAYDLYGEEGAAEMEGETTLPKVTNNYGTGSEFQYGTIKGSKYTSKFSGLTFEAPKGWTLQGASKGSVSPTSVLDLYAYNSNKTMTVKLQYFSLEGGSYTSTGQIINALKAQVGDDVETKTVTKRIGSRTFSGFAFDGMNGQDTARSQIMVTQVEGYALVLQVVAPTQNDIDNILKNFS